jgi:hypothetical protein
MEATLTWLQNFFVCVRAMDYDTDDAEATSKEQRRLVAELTRSVRTALAALLDRVLECR